jgi:CRISPR-associated endonuclease/helicase Cas3
MSRGQSRAERLREMERLYVQRAYTDIEMAERLGVDRTTVFKDRRELERNIPFVDVEPGRWKIDQTRYLSEIRVNLHEALALYLAARRASRQTRTAQPHVAGALEKLAAALKQPMTEQLVKAASAVLMQSSQPERVAAVETIAQAWVERRRVRISHRSLRGRRALTYVVSPYLIEPSLWGDGAYVIGYSDVHSGLATFKVERIEHAFLTSDAFTVPDTFDDQELLKHAWGIWYGDDEPVTVRLRFAPGEAARRLKESIWHPTQHIEDTDDGGCLWTVQVAEWQEILPWVRGWGADAEVLEPKELREALVREAQHLATLYQVSDTRKTPPHRLLWAKAERTTGKLHRLIYHLIDVGQTASALWRIGLSEPIRQRLAAWLGLSVEDAGRLIAFWAALHDLGKASPAFQDHPYMPSPLRALVRRELQAAGLTLPNRSLDEKRARHEVISTWALGKNEKLLAEETGLPLPLAKHIAQALGGHHGAWPVPRLFDAVHLKPDDKGGAEWAAARRELVRELKTVFELPVVTWTSRDDDNVMLTLLSGIISVADWLGSDERLFGFEDNVIPTASYARYSQRIAECQVAQSGWRVVPTFSKSLDFRAAFGFPASEAQREAIAAASAIRLPALVILEMPMGSGKTELGFGIYSEWAQRAGGNGLYVAMPTTATSNQMHGRAESFLKKRYGDDVTTLLVHSQALLRDEAGADADSDPVEERDREGDRAAALAWFLPRKRSLLAPFGVGTVDQALMSVLQTKHFFVRLLGLSHKVVIFDEVHAYDTYMSTLFQRLLTWLRELGASVILLSATLPEKARRDLVQAYTGRDDELPAADYPRVTLAGIGESPRVASLPAPSSRALTVEWMPRDPADILARLQAELRDGGCAAVICNTVTRAQEVYRALAGSEFRSLSEDLMLFHARFPLAWREDIERQVLAKFGTDRGRRPAMAIVVATQVIEQSLDLDFDVMISDLCPADLLLQRVGRLHRHAAARAHPYRVWIAAPDTKSSVPALDRADKFVYEEYILLRSWLALGAGLTREATLPDDLSALIEAVYGDGALSGPQPEMGAALEAAKRKLEKDERGDRFKARQRMVRQPDDEDLLMGENLGLEEDDPQVHAAFQALTRVDAPGLQVVCLHQIGDALMLDPDGMGGALNLESKPPRSLVRELARRTVTIQRLDIINHLLEAPASPMIEKALNNWKKIPALRYHRLVIFHDGVCPLAGTPYTLRLSREFGLEITKEAR